MYLVLLFSLVVLLVIMYGYIFIGALKKEDNKV
jgi:hypothetical protein